MIKKVISILSVLIMLLFISCASSQPEADDTKDEKPAVEAPVVDTPDNENKSDSEKDKTESSENTSVETEENSTAEDNSNGAENTVITENTDSTESTEADENLSATESTGTTENTDIADSTGSTETTISITPSDNSDEQKDTESDAETNTEADDSEQDTDSAESEDEETADEEPDEFADLEVPEDFEEPLVRDLYLSEAEDDGENTGDEENPDEDLEQDNEDEDSELAETSEDEADEIIEEPEPEEIIIPSRSVTLRKGENLAIVYPGSGWIYMGSLSEYSNMASKGRKLGSQDTKYTLLAKEAGTQIHHFYKVDNLTGEYIDDYIEITVLDKKGSSKTTITAPAYVEVVPQKPETPAKESKPSPEPKQEVEQTEEPAQTKQPEQTPKQAEIKEEKPAPSSTASTASSSDEPDIPLLLDETNSEDDVINVEEDEVFAVQEQQPQINTDEILENAKSAFEQKQYEESFTLLTEFFEYAIDRQDEALYLQGQLLESDSSIKDIKGAVQAYELLVKNYPSSIYWNDASKRIKYLRRFYYLSN